MDGTHYAGDWYGDRPSGFGLEVYPDGEIAHITLP